MASIEKRLISDVIERIMGVVNVFNAMVENKDYFIDKWQAVDGNELVRYKAKQFIGILADAESINEFDENLYFALVEKVTVYDGRIVVSLLDGTNVECEIARQ
ncbi:MAG: recombinase [Smithella sp.]